MRLARLAATDLAGPTAFARFADHAADGTERDWRHEVWKHRPRVLSGAGR